MQQGVPLALANYGKQQVSDVTYDPSFTIPKKKEAPIEAVLVLDFEISNLKAALSLDFKEETSFLKSMSITRNPEEIIHVKEHIVLPVRALEPGPNQIEIKFLMGGLPLNRNDEYLYTLLLPDRARPLFPCFDQPNIKAKYRLTVTAPADWQVHCVAPIKQVTHEVITTVHEFGQTKNISTHLFSFVAGKFQKAILSPEGSRHPL